MAARLPEVSMTLLAQWPQQPSARTNLLRIFARWFAVFEAAVDEWSTTK
jgi:hypothetical protein